MCAWAWGDSFDLYAAPADMFNGYWDTAGGQPGNLTLSAGRFSGSRAMSWSSGSGLPSSIKTSGVNDAIHHIVLAFQQINAISGSSNGAYIQFRDGATAQCCIVFRSDGAILLTSGTQTGTTLATYTGAVTAASTWYAFELEVVIHPTAGAFRVRKNGNSVSDFDSGATLATRGGTANNYANAIAVGEATSFNHLIDDFYWRSDAASVPWMGDIRCFTRMPTSDAAVQFSHTPAAFSLPYGPSGGPLTLIVGSARYSGYLSQGSSLSSVVVTLLAGYTGNLKCAIFACTSTLGFGVGAILGTATAPITNPVLGANTFTFSPAIAIPSGTLFYVGICSDTTAGSSINSSNASPTSSYGAASATAYASFPVASPTLSAPQSANVNASPGFVSANFLYVSEPQQDAATSYVYDSTPGHADLYGIATITSAPAITIAVTTRAYLQKSDAGTRTAAAQLKSGSTTVASPTLTLTTSGWLWTWRTDTVDPATSAAWTAAAVNAANVGVTVVA